MATSKLLRSGTQAESGNTLPDDPEVEVSNREDVQHAPQSTTFSSEIVKQTAEAAQDHIARIRRDKGLDLGVDDEDLGSNVSDLTAALEV